MTLKIITNSPWGNLAVNRATCSGFIDESRKGEHWPCFKCDKKRIMRTFDVYEPITVCPCGMYYTAADDPDVTHLYIGFEQLK